MKISTKVFQSIEKYILFSLEHPMHPGAKLELVPELVRLLWEVRIHQSVKDEQQKEET